MAGYQITNVVATAWSLLYSFHMVEPWNCPCPDAATCQLLRLCSYGEADGCDKCRKVYPPALLKANSDPFDYAAYVQGLGIVEFHELRIFGDWVSLQTQDDREFEGLPYPFPRGIDVPISSILWIADAPSGS